MGKFLQYLLISSLIFGGSMIGYNNKIFAETNENNVVLSTSEGTQIKIELDNSEEIIDKKVYKVENGVKQELIIQPSRKKTDYRMEFNLENEEYLKIAQDEFGNDTNSANIFNKNGESIAVVLIPISKAENGKEVDAEVSVENKNVLKIEVEPSVQSTFVQIQALSYSYSDYFSSGKWITRDGLISLSLSPKKLVYERHSNPNLHAAIGVDSWNKVVNKHSSSSNWKNTAQMKNQYICHRDYAQGFKTPWNLEPARPLVSYAETVKHACNNPL